MRLTLDENLPAALARLLREHGHDVETVLGEGPRGRTDAEVAGAARAAGRLFITIDRGVLADPADPGRDLGVIVLQPGDVGAPAVTAAMRALLERHDLDALAGATVVVTHNRIRIRRPGGGTHLTAR